MHAREVAPSPASGYEFMLPNVVKKGELYTMLANPLLFH